MIIDFLIMEHISAHRATSPKRLSEFNKQETSLLRIEGAKPFYQTDLAPSLHNNFNPPVFGKPGSSKQKLISRKLTGETGEPLCFFMISNLYEISMKFFLINDFCSGEHPIAGIGYEKAFLSYSFNPICPIINKSDNGGDHVAHS